MCFSKLFAKIGFGGVYITELTILILAPAVLFHKRSQRSTFEIWLGFLILFHVATTILIDIHRYSFGEVIRDAIIWLYPVTALYVASYRNIDVDELIEIFRKVIVVWLYLYPLFFYLSSVQESLMFGHFVIKKQDTATAFSLFILIAFHYKTVKIRYVLLLVLGMFLVSTQGRSSLLILFFSIIGALYISRKDLSFIRISKKHLVLAGFFILTLSLLNLQTSTRSGRQVSFEQVISNTISIFGDSESASNIEATEAFRLFWWADILIQSWDQRAVFYGHGYGLNLADYYGYQVERSGLLRSPHNFLMTLVARSGWLITLSLSLFVALVILMGLNMKGIYASIAVIIAMMFVNGLFDVYLEGPMGAFPFWFFVGIILSKAKDRSKKTQMSIDKSREVLPEDSNT